MSEKKDLVLFFGAGISMPSGMPLVQHLESMILDGKYTFENSGFAEADTSNEAMIGIQDFLRLVKKTDEYYLQKISPFKRKDGVSYSGALFRSANNYEVLYHICHEIYLESVGLTDLPMIGAFVELLAQNRFDETEGIDKILKIEKLATDASQFILWIVSKRLNVKVDNILGLDLLLDLYKSESIGNISIITLNHDILLETFFETHGMAYDDGFENTFGDEDKKFVGFKDSKIKLIKPHGSINWYTKKENQEEFYYKKAHGDWVEKPNFLTGAGKIESYNYSIYSEMMFEVHKTLMNNCLMIMSGYGWGDAAMNGRLSRWVERDTNQLLLLYENAEDLKKSSVFWAGSYGNVKGVTTFNKWFCDSRIEEIERFLSVDEK